MTTRPNPTGDILTDPDVLEYVGQRFDEFLDRLFSDDEAEDHIIDWTVSYFPVEYERATLGDDDPLHKQDQMILDQAQSMVEWAVAKALEQKLLEYMREITEPKCYKCSVSLGWTGAGWMHPTTSQCPVKEVW